MEVRHRSAENRERVDFNTAKMGALHSLARAVNPHGYPSTPKTWFLRVRDPHAPLSSSVSSIDARFVLSVHRDDHQRGQAALMYRPPNRIAFEGNRKISIAAGIRKRTLP